MLISIFKHNFWFVLNKESIPNLRSIHNWIEINSRLFFDIFDFVWFWLLFCLSCWNWVTRALLLWNFSWRSSFSKTIVGVRYESTQLWLNFINQNKSFVNIEDYFYKKERPFLVFFCLRYSNSILIERKKRHKWFSILTCFRIWTLGQGLG